MPIDITIIKSPDNVNNSNNSLTFSESGGTMGRGAGNTWVLEDPDKYMSSTHTRIGFENGQYFLTDLSTNGTFINGSTEPLGNGNKVFLNEGDRFAISDYEFIVNIRGANQASMDSGPFQDLNMQGSSNSGNFDPGTFSQNDPFGSPINGYVPSTDPIVGLDNAETDPLAALDKANSINQSPFQDSPFPDSNSTDGFGDSGAAMNDSISWPNANIETGMIPEDWNETQLGNNNLFANQTPANKAGSDNFPPNSFSNVEALSKLENEYLALENENKKLIRDVAKLKQFIIKQNAKGKGGEQQSNRTITTLDKTLFEAMGFSDKNLSDEKKMQISETVGFLVRETMEGMMRVLSFRKKIKEEFRINVTTIQPVENNPLKFSANIDDALVNMFIKENNAYKEPIEAVREGFQGIAEHQVAVLAGMQAAFRGMLERFDPETLEKRFEKYKKAGLIHIGKKKKNWDSYKEYHAELENNLDNSFQYLFGYDFVQAYEEQMQRLVISRNSNKKK